jgi:two-component system cell cycle sensor histidine kinase/response regulator CckA
MAAFPACRESPDGRPPSRMDSDRPPDNARPQSVSLTMVATLASELRNQLAVIVTSIDTIRRAIPPGPEIERVLAELERAIDGGVRVSYEMVAMVQPRVAEPTVADLNEVVSQTRYVIERLVGEHVTVWINLTPFDTVVRAASIDVEWLLLNLASNAADAMPGGGLLTIETDLIRIPFNVPVSAGRARRSYGRLTVTDTGGGMTPPVRARAAEPFFSTRSGAFGLGLTSVALIVRRLGGYIRVAMTGTHGTSLEVYLPTPEPGDDTDVNSRG